jgi:tRNA G26 N,N-dimethylase Trm1
MGHGYASVAQSGIAATATDITSCTTTFTADASRRYRTMLQIPRVDQATALGTVITEIVDAAAATLRATRLTLGIGEFGSLVVVLIETGLTGSTTRKATLRTTAGTVSTAGSSVGSLPLIVVEDIGGV